LIASGVEDDDGKPISSVIAVASDVVERTATIGVDRQCGGEVAACGADQQLFVIRQRYAVPHAVSDICPTAQSRVTVGGNTQK
jgi:hypothetical protein